MIVCYYIAIICQVYNRQKVRIALFQSAVTVEMKKIISIVNESGTTTVDITLY